MKLPLHSNIQYDNKALLKLFTTSKTIAIEEDNKTTIALNVESKTLATIPMILVFTIT